MKLPIVPSTQESRKQLLIESLMNETSKVSKVAPHSVLSGLAYGISMVAGKAEKDIAIAIGHMFPEFSSGTHLDSVAQNLGIAPRYSSTPSQVYVRVVGTPGTTYQPNVHTFQSSGGISFTPSQNFSIPAAGFGYMSLRSTVAGNVANVDALTINSVSPVPAGHQYVVNEVAGTGGRDTEDDNTFRKRIQQGANALARSTKSSLEQFCMKVNPLVSRIIHCGVTSLGKSSLGVVTINGVALSNQELATLTVEVKDWVSLTDTPPSGTASYGFEFFNIPLFPIDVSMRVQLDNSMSFDSIRNEMMENIQNYLLGLREKKFIKVEWDDLLVIAKRTKGVNYVADQFFYPRVDIQVPHYNFPILRGFQLLDLQGGIISDFSGNLVPSFYPAQIDFQYQEQFL